MEATQVSSNVPKPSFAKVAASASKETIPVASVRPITASGQDKAAELSADHSPTPAEPTAGNIITNGVNVAGQIEVSDLTINAKSEKGAPAGTTASVETVVDGLKDLHLGARTPSLVVNGSGSSLTGRSKSLNRDGSDDSQRADSNSELDTKPPSLDGKSITSGTTFALDEKESLRPDDSASVKAAAAEDDDSFSFRGPFLPNSRMGSDIAARARGIQLGDMPDRRIPAPTPGSLAHGGVITPQSASSDQPPPPKQDMASITDLSKYMNAIHGQTPDEKLLEAMSSPKDRLFLLRLEAELIKFVQNSKEPFMDFPPSNSFCRMLTHKLADYYHMTHQFEPRIGSVRIFRTPYARVPDSLASIGIPEPKAEPVPIAVLPRKIMRRGEDGDAAVSASASKATSEDGSELKEKAAPANQKLSREQREEAYKQARERIFGSSEKTGESTPDHEGENDISRASSVSAKERVNAGKKGKASKQRRDDTDLDSRHLYGPFGPQQTTWVQQTPYGVAANAQYPVAMQQPYGGQQMQPAYSAPGQPYPAQQMQAGYPSYSPMPAYQTPPQAQHPPQTSQQRGQAIPNSNIGTYGSPVPAGPQPAWQQGHNATGAPVPMPTAPAAGPPPNTSSFGPRGVSAPPSHPHSPSVPYAYGQLPANLNPNDPKSQHPIPGSYNRHAFNPKTQSFVPGGALGPMQTPQPPFSAPGSHHGSPQIGSPHLSYVGYQQAGPPPAPFGLPAAYGMARQGSNHSLPAYHPPPQHPHQHIPPMQPQPQQCPPMQPCMPYQGHQPIPHNPPPAHIPSKPAAPQGSSGQPFSHLPQYGNPATLPQKPARGI